MSEKQQYVKITQKSHFYQWYNNLIGVVFPVTPYESNTKKVKVIGTGNAIALEDCEPYEFPQEQRLDEHGNETMSIGWLEQKAQGYADANYHIVKGSYENKAVANAYKAGYHYSKSNYATGFDAGFKQAQRNLTIGHSITEDQISILANKCCHMMDVRVRLKEWFPEVFKPKKSGVTVKVGSTIQTPRSNFKIIGLTRNSICLVDEKTSKGMVIKVEDIENIDIDDLQFDRSKVNIENN